MTTFVLLSLLGLAAAQQAAWAQCGGTSYTGGTSCSSGHTCVKLNQYYSQCQPSTSQPTTTVTSSPTTTTATPPSASSTLSNSSSTGTGKLQWIGINESGPEFGDGKYPGQLNKDYVWPDLTTIDTFIAKGINLFRINFSQERLVPNQLTGPMNQTYFSDLKKTVDYITQKGAYAMITPHNYGRYYGNIITDTAGFKTYWTTTAKPFADNSKVIFDINNEFHDMDQTLVLNLNQAGIDGIRAAGATTQYITPEGNSWTGAWTWLSAGNTNLAALTDPSNMLVYQMHQYLDSDGSGTSATCVSSTIGAERVQAATQWLKQNNKKGLIGEFAGGVNDQCETAVKGMLDVLAQNSDVWLGAVWWAAGPWWADYIYSIEPSTGVAYNAYMPILTQYK